MNVNLKQRFQEILEDNRILEAELMSRHTTFRIGGPADFFLVPENADEIRRIIAVCKEKKCSIFYSWKWKQSSCKRQGLSGSGSAAV